MKWSQDDVSPDVEDRRGESGGGRFGGGMKLGLGGFIVLAVLSLIFKKNFFALLDGGAAPPSASTTERPNAPPPPGPPDERVRFVSFVVDDVQRTWEKEFARGSARYEHAKLVLFRDATRSGCGFAEAAMGPFYCSEDRKVYLDLGFFDELRSRFGAPGEFAEAYVIAHEFGHHVQMLLGTEARVHRAMEDRPNLRNQLSVRLELQADCLAGVWAHSTDERQILEKGDVESGLAAAAAVGDDRLQRAGGGRVNPERWTHGSSRERVEWFRRGLETGSANACDTFAAPGL